MFGYFSFARLTDCRTFPNHPSSDILHCRNSEDVAECDCASGTERKRDGGNRGVGTGANWSCDACGQRAGEGIKVNGYSVSCFLFLSMVALARAHLESARLVRILYLSELR
jgi:hypothetical protein